MRAAVRLLIVMAAVGALASPVRARADLPRPTGAINDFANVLTAAERDTLTRLVEEVEQATTAEIAVATVPSLDGLTVEDYATQLFAAWGVGQAGKDNGVLILVAPADRAMRIEVGYGLEGVLPDGLAGQIVRETFLPAFRDGAFGRGIVEGTTRVAGIVRRNERLTDQQLRALAAADTSDTTGPTAYYVLVPFFGVFIGIGAGFAGAGMGARVFGPILFGLIFSGVPLFITWLIDMPIGRTILLGVAFVAFIVGLRWGRSQEGKASLRSGATTKGKTGWVWGGGSSGGSWSSGSSRSSGSSGSSGGFGGGRSGGGGASGRW